MNILDIDDETVQATINELDSDDKLEQLFELQGQHHNCDPEMNLETHEGQEKVREYAYWTIEEMMEAMNELKNRPWTQTDYRVDRDHLRDEVADVFGFLIQWLRVMGYDAEDVRDMFIRKQKVNEFRGETGY